MKSKIGNWIVPITETEKTLGEAYGELQAFGAKQEDIPFLVQMIENPKWDLPGIDIFHGATDLKTHDLIHIILGRGIHSKDEAFVIGFTMGSSNRVSTTEETLYTLFAKHLYPKVYQFSDADADVYKDAVKLGFISDCQSLAKVDYDQYMDLKIPEVRKQIGIEEDLIKAYYAIEKKRYPDSKTSQRLL